MTYLSPLTQFLKQLNGIITIIEGCAFSIIAILYWVAYFKMKKTPIIGSIALIASVAAFTMFFLGISLIIPNNTSLIINAFLRIIVIICAVYFIRASLIPVSNKSVKHIRKVSKAIKKKK